MENYRGDGGAVRCNSTAVKSVLLMLTHYHILRFDSGAWLLACSKQVPVLSKTNDFGAVGVFSRKCIWRVDNLLGLGKNLVNYAAYVIFLLFIGRQLKWSRTPC